MDILSYQLENADQFWEGKSLSLELFGRCLTEIELTDLSSGDYHSAPSIEKALSAYIRFASLFLGMPCHVALYLGLGCGFANLTSIEKYLADDEELTKCVEKLFYSPIFRSNKAYVRRKLISLLLKDGELDVARKILVGAFLLIDGRMNAPTMEMMQEESAIACIVETLWKRQSESLRLRRIFLELMYELCRVQKLRHKDLEVVSTGFVVHLYRSIEDRDDYDHDPYGYAVLKVLLALNEQYMVAAYDLSVSKDPDQSPLVKRTQSLPLPNQHERKTKYFISNKVFETLVNQRDNFRVFGENIVLLLNRGPDDCLQLMVLKFLYLMFTTPETYDCLYLNDLKVILDIFVRELYNLSSDEERLRHTYLRVLHPLLQNTELRRDSYKKAEIISLLEDMSENACKSVVEISETTQRLAYRCLLVGWLDHSSATVSHQNSSLHLDRFDCDTIKEGEPLELTDSVVSSIMSTASVSTEDTAKMSDSPSSVGSPISPISSHSFNASLSLQDPTPVPAPAPALVVSYPDTPGSPSTLSFPPPPPPSRTPRTPDSISSKRSQRSTPPPIPGSGATVHRPVPPPPLPLPRKKPSLANLKLGMSMPTTRTSSSAMDLAPTSEAVASPVVRPASAAELRRAGGDILSAPPSPVGQGHNGQEVQDESEVEHEAVGRKVPPPPLPPRQPQSRQVPPRPLPPRPRLAQAQSMH